MKIFDSKNWLFRLIQPWPLRKEWVQFSFKYSRRLFTTDLISQNYLSSIELPSFTTKLIQSFTTKFKHSLCIRHIQSLFQFSEKLTSLISTAYVKKNTPNCLSYCEMAAKYVEEIKLISLKASYCQTSSSFTDIELLFQQAEMALESFLTLFITHFKKDSTFRESFQFSDTLFLELIKLSSTFNLVKSNVSVQFLQHLFRDSIPRISIEHTQFLLLAQDESLISQAENVSPQQAEFAEAFIIQSISHCKPFFIEPYLKCLLSPDVNRIAFLRPASPFLLAVRILEKTDFDFTDILNLLFFKIGVLNTCSLSFSKKKSLLYESLSQALHLCVSNNGSPLVRDSLRLIPCYTFSFAQLVFSYLLNNSIGNIEKEHLLNDIDQYFNEIKKSGKASLLSYLLYIRYLKKKGSLEELKLLELEMHSSEWVGQMERIRNASDVTPNDDAELMTNIHYFLQYVLEISLPNIYKFHHKLAKLNSLVVPMSPENARDAAFISAFAKLKSWSDVYRIFSKAKSDGRLDVPVSGLVSSPVFHFSCSSVILKCVLKHIPWNESSSYLQFPSPLLSREGCKLIYTHLYFNLFNLLISNDKFLLIQCIVSIARTTFINDEYVLVNALSALALSSGKGPLSPPNRILFYKLLSNRLDIDVTCEVTTTPPSNFAGIFRSIDSQLSTLLHFIELYKLPLHSTNFNSLLFVLFRKRRYDLISQAYLNFPPQYKQEQCSQYIFLLTGLRNKNYIMVGDILNDKAKSLIIPEENLLKEYLSKPEVSSILPSSISSVTALDEWRFKKVITDQEYSASLSICSSYMLETLFYLRRFIQIHHNQEHNYQPHHASKHFTQLSVNVRFPESVVKLASIPSYLMDYEAKYFSFKRRDYNFESNEQLSKSNFTISSDNAVLEDLISESEEISVLNY